MYQSCLTHHTEIFSSSHKHLTESDVADRTEKFVWLRIKIDDWLCLM